MPINYRHLRYCPPCVFYIYFVVKFISLFFLYFYFQKYEKEQNEHKRHNIVTGKGGFCLMSYIRERLKKIKKTIWIYPYLGLTHLPTPQIRIKTKKRHETGPINCCHPTPPWAYEQTFFPPAQRIFPFANLNSFPF